MKTKTAAKIIMVLGLAFIAYGLSACGENSHFTDPAPTPTPCPCVSPSPVVNTTVTIQQIVDEENANRSNEGDEPLVPGLVCTLYLVPNTTTAIIPTQCVTGIANWSYSGVFDQAEASVTTGLNIMPIPLQETYQTWFVVKCSGVLVVDDNNWHEFALTSDDGSNLYIDGLLINNDGLHAVETVSAPKYLYYGLHSFELDFLQGTGMQALILNEDGAVMGNQGFYH